jgi:hypothetical protein
LFFEVAQGSIPPVSRLPFVTYVSRKFFRGELVTYVMECADIRKLNEPDFSASLRIVPPSLHVIDEGDVPDNFWNPQPPKLDRQALLAHLKTNQSIPGVSLNNGAQTVSIRTK